MPSCFFSCRYPSKRTCASIKWTKYISLTDFCVENASMHYKTHQKSFTWRLLVSRKLQINVIFMFGDHLGRHIGFLGSPSYMPIYAGRFRSYWSWRTFYYMACLVIPGVRVTARNNDLLVQKPHYYMEQSIVLIVIWKNNMESKLWINTILWTSLKKQEESLIKIDWLL